jgi:hypothetical protein
MLKAGLLILVTGEDDKRVLRVWLTGKRRATLRIESMWTKLESCIRSTPTEMQSVSGKDFDCLANTGRFPPAG